MNRVYVNLGIGMFWLFAAGLCYLTGELNTALLAVCLILAAVYFWAAFRIFVNPNLVKKNKKNLIQQVTDPNYKSTFFNKKK